MRRLSQNLLAGLAALATILLGIEAIVRFVPPVPAASSQRSYLEPMFTEDAINGATPNPLYWDHDAAGWRNDTALAQADIVALGDSQTYGIGAVRADSWPAQLAGMVGAPVYQMALGGYNPTTFLRLAPQVLAHKPRIVVLGIYFGANFSQAYDETYKRVEHPELVAFRSHDTDLLQTFEAAERIDGHRWIRSGYLDCQRPTRAPDPALLRIEDILASPDLAPLAGLPSNPVLEANGGASVLLDELVKRVAAARKVEEARYSLGPPWCLDHATAGVETILTPAYRLLNLETTDPRIVEGERIVIAASRRLAEIMDGAGAQLFVLLIPTKELAFRYEPADPTAPELHYLERLWELESAARRRVASALLADGIEVIDALPALQSLIARGVDPYLGKDGNGHPSSVGYEAIARTVATSIGSAVHAR